MSLHISVLMGSPQLAGNLTLHHKLKMTKIHLEAAQPQPSLSQDKGVPTLGCGNQSSTVPVWMWRGFLCPVIATWNLGVTRIWVGSSNVTTWLSTAD